MNHRVNAIVHNLPECPECGALPNKPCVAARGLFTPVAPHDIRLRVKTGEVVVLEVADARAIHRLRELRDLAGTIAARRQLHFAIDNPHPAMDLGHRVHASMTAIGARKGPRKRQPIERKDIARRRSARR